MPVTRQTPSGLVVAEEAADERSVQAQLRRLDRSLVLTRETHPAGGLEYVVVKTFADDALVLCRWRDEVTGAALPLSSGLVDKVDRARRDSRAPQVDVVDWNARLADRVRAEMDEAAADAARATERRSGRLPLFHRSRGLYLSRARARARGEEA